MRSSRLIGSAFSAGVVFVVRTTTMLLLPVAGFCAAEDSAARPNIIVIMTDDQGWGDTGYNGNPEVKTPNIDRLAASGIRF